jgi:hypothetical protein
MTLCVMVETTSYHLPGSGSILVATYLLGMSVNVDMRSEKMYAASTRTELFKNWNTHSTEKGGFFELLISKKVIYEEQKQLCSLVQVKEMANCSISFINEQFRYNARRKQCQHTKFLRRI